MSDAALKQFHRRIRDGIDALCVGRLTCTAERPISLSTGRATAWLDEAEAINTATALLGAAQAPISVLRWHAGTLPEDETTVLIADEDGEVWLGYHTDGQWHGIDAMPLNWTPTEWAHPPQRPAKQN